MLNQYLLNGLYNKILKVFKKAYRHTWATEFPTVWVWVRVGYPQLTIYPRQLKNSGVQPTIYPRQPKNSGVQPTIYPRQPKYSGIQPTIYTRQLKNSGIQPTTDFLKHLILSYSFEIKQINERTNIYLKFYFKIMFFIS